MIEVVVKIIIAYLIGGIMGGDVMRRIVGGEDLRKSGSGNVGTTNALRTRGKGFALGVLAIDAGKGIIAALLVPHLPWPVETTIEPISLAMLGYVCGVAVAVGHCFPLFHQFRGGKGMATLAGVFVVLLPWAFPWILLVFVIVVLTFGYVALASLCAAATAVIVVGTNPGLASASGAFVIAMAVLVTVRHAPNIKRLATGTEARMDKLRLVGNKIDQWRAH